MAQIPIQLNYITQQHWTNLLRFLDSEDVQERKAYMSDYATMPECLQAELGYMASFLQAGSGGFVSPYRQASLAYFSGVPELLQPFAFNGWAGEHSEVGPRYCIHTACFDNRRPWLFYCDGDYLHEEKRTRALAEDIAAASPELQDVQVRQVEMIPFPGDTAETGWAVCFRAPENTDTATFNLPRVGEYDCILGEIMSEDPCSGYILARHSYCLK